MGGEYVTGRKEGSSFGWKGLNGETYTQGFILKLILAFDISNSKALSKTGSLGLNVKSKFGKWV